MRIIGVLRKDHIPKAYSLRIASVLTYSYMPSGERKIPASPLDIPALNLEPLDVGQKRDTQFLVHIFIENPIDDRLLHQKGLVERQKFLLRSLIPGLRPEQ